MGEFIRMGVISEFRIAKSSILETGIDLEKARIVLSSAVVENSVCFDCMEEGSMVVWRLKPEISEKYLAGLLKAVFTDFYGKDTNDYERYAKPVLDYLSRSPSTVELYNWIEEGDAELFFDRDERRSIDLAKRKIIARIYNISLTCEGKVMYEKIEQHLQFFESAIRKAYADHQLGGCLMITIG